ncbi:MAG: hypothetical protein U9O96_08525 [Candidatus Thermoplasmatota archaeon]|nr:hypothetical protein [Candidatus Thermoplasmatota archaeon]
MRIKLTDNEKLVLYGLVRYPTLKDKELSEKLGLKHSTVISIRRRLREHDYFRTIRLPMLQNFGCEILVVSYTNFNPVIPLQKRIEVTEEKIEVSEELFFSLGEFEKGFSLSLSRDYTNIGKINDVRTETFGKLGLLEKDYPTEAIFPFDISKIYRFFYYPPLIKKYFRIEKNDDEEDPLEKGKKIHLSGNEKIVFHGLVKYPEESDKRIGNLLNVSRHTVSRMRKRFEENGYIKQFKMPNLSKVGFEILAFYHIRYDPSNPPDFDGDEVKTLLNDRVIFMATRRFETVIIGAYTNYEEYKTDKVEKMQFLKGKKWIAKNPVIRTYSLSRSIVIKDFTFAPITKKVLELEQDIG